jgi:D-3-phosphoglycerate dehydrogenase
MKRILIVEPMHEAGASLVEGQAGYEVIHAPDTSIETLVPLMKDVHAVAVRTAKLPHEVLAASECLEIVSRHGVGCDNLDMEYLNGRRVPVAIALNANAVSVAEHTLMLMLAVVRRLREQDIAVREGRFAERNSLFGGDLMGARALIVGHGAIGRLVAGRCRAFGMSITIAGPNLTSANADGPEDIVVQDFRSGLAEADFVSLHLPLTASTRNMISTAEFTQMKPGAILINTARGGIVDEAALVRALETGHLAGAGIDVFNEEPPDPDHPLLSRNDVLLTPHNGTASHGAMREMARMTFQNIRNYYQGDLPRSHVFNPDVLSEDQNRPA